MLVVINRTLSSSPTVATNNTLDNTVRFHLAYTVCLAYSTADARLGCSWNNKCEVSSLFASPIYLVFI
jgi:hypothetical protein